jgi:hypothetical protein
VNSVHNVERDTYRLIVTRRNASEILLLASGHAWSLPAVEISRGQRVAEQLTRTFQVATGLQAYCLFVPKSAASDRTPRCAKYAAMEVLNQNDRVPSRTFWIPSAVATRESIRPADDSVAIKQLLKELSSYVRQPNTGPFAKPGWFRELLEWVHERIDPLGLRLTGGFLQVNAGPAFSLIRLETKSSAVWFKATGQPNLHELPISVSLARLFPEFTPPLLGVHSSWNGWLSQEVSRTTLDDFVDLSDWRKAADSLAQLQIRSIGKDAELRESRCKDLRLDKLIEEIDPFLARMAELMATQKKRVPAALTNSELTVLGERLKDACSLLQELGLPDTLGHMDLSPSNILISPERCVFLDWAEGCVTNPFITFEYLREHLQRAWTNDARAVESTVAAYMRPWQSVLSPEVLKQAMVVSPLVAVFAYAIASNGWRSPESASQPPLAGYLRGLTRRMYREGVLIVGRSERCLV